ncbi:glycosyl hydrolase [Ramlibacter sp. AW1]|uniref:Glycosyl hydrolase n=1 Tax=Ramlibacter aurantiacus TaxID=2801330 RepID=A0A937D802_9BURK|nr:glycosyl hydrolase [Ramlibacter aurantiacus]MBL0422543.1 glycosyl hydrolase [Ramlibacter aurantiacus]
MNRKTFYAVAFAVAVAPMAWWSVSAAASVSLTHVHGLTYSADGSKLMVPSHHGLAVFSSGQWSKASGPEHDYMGFAGTKSALYSSGHPAPGSGLKNPFGLIKSTDGGASWKQLGLEGESDFHTMAASHGTNAVYVVNPQPNSRMRTAGIYFTMNDGLKWERAEARGLVGRPLALAVHPTDASTLAAATEQGLYLSKDAGASFKPLATGQRALAAAFTLDGKELWWSGFEGRPTLTALPLQEGAKPRRVVLPAMGEDAVSYIAQNPARTQEMAVATFKKSVFVSADGGGTWTRVANEGETAATAVSRKKD